MRHVFCRFLLMLFFMLACVTPAFAGFMPEEKALILANNWIKHNAKPLDTEIGRTVAESFHYQREGFGYYLVLLEPQEWLVIPYDDSFEPILAFGGERIDKSGWDASPLASICRRKFL